MGRRSDCKGKIRLKPLLLLAVFALSQTACHLSYLIKQATYQACLSCGALPVEKVLLDPNLSENNRSKLGIVRVLKRFSVNKMKMRESKNYTLINPTWHHKLHVVSATKELSFDPYIWDFPIVGQMPYLGFFDERDAKKEFDKLKALGYDAMISESGGYSTLGFFNDPIWPKMLERSVHSLSELVLHELAHSNLYFKSQSSFNESFANFVGRKGALQFLSRNYGLKSIELTQAVLQHEDEMLYHAWIEGIYDPLSTIYKGTQSENEKRRLKSEEIARAQESFGKLSFKSLGYQNIEIPKINNAYILMSRRYNTNQDDFEKIFKGLNEDWGEFFAQMKTLNNEADPFKSLKKMASNYDLGES